jgi:hypothetical protein
MKLKKNLNRLYTIIYLGEVFALKSNTGSFGKRWVPFNVRS